MIVRRAVQVVSLSNDREICELWCAVIRPSLLPKLRRIERRPSKVGVVCLTLDMAGVLRLSL